MPTIGASAPTFRLRSHQGGEVALEQFRSDRHVVLVFYPLDFSGVCSNQLPEYSGYRTQFEERGAIVLGVNRDSVHTHRAWAREFGIELPLLADMTGAAARSYGVWNAEAGFSERAVFLIDREGVLRWQHVETTIDDFTVHAPDVLAELDKLQS
jgi:peroxiredoxin